MGLLLTDIEKVDRISKQDFINNYLDARRPLVIRKATETWPALQK